MEAQAILTKAQGDIRAGEAGTARDHLQALLLELGSRPGADLRLLSDLHRLLAEAHRQLQTWSEAREHADLAIDQARAARDDQRLAKAALLAGQLDVNKSRWEQASRSFTEALRSAPNSPRIRWLASEGLAKILWRQGKSRAAIPHVRDALQQVRSTNDRRGEGTCLALLGSALHDLGEIGESVRCFEEAVAIFRELAEPAELARCLHNLGDTHRFTGDWVPALAALQESVEVCRTHGLGRGLMYGLVSLADTLITSGEPDQAALHLDEAAALVVTLEDPYARSVILLAQADLHGARGAVTAARATYRAATDRFADQDIPFDQSAALLHWGRFEARKASPERARELLLQAQVIAKATDAVLLQGYIGKELERLGP